MTRVIERTTRHRAGALFAGASAGGSLWWLGVGPGFAGAVGAAVLVVVLLLSRLVRTHPEFTTSDEWRDHAWATTGVVFLNLVVFQGLLWVPVSFADRVGLFVLVSLTWVAGYTAGGLDALGSDSARDHEGQAGSQLADD